MGHHIVDQQPSGGDGRTGTSTQTDPVFTSADRIAIPTVAIEQLRTCIRTPKAGKAGREQIRAAIAPICEEAKRSAAMPEQLLVSLKELCNSLPEYGRMRGASERGAFLDTVVSLAIEEFYRS